MAFNYTALAASATSLIRRAGAPVAFTRKGDSTYDTEAGDSESTPQKSNGVAVRIEYTLQERQNSAILETDVRLLAAAEGLPQPQPGDEAVFDGDTYSVVDCRPIKPATIVIVYDIQARKI